MLAMRIFITGGSGFIGRRLVAMLVAQGAEVLALAHSARSERLLAELGATVVPGDIMDVASMRGAMAGCDLVYHLAAILELGNADPVRMEMINVAGTRKVLSLAHELGVPRIIYTSSLAVLGDTHGELATESFQPQGPFLTEYDRTKWLAHYQVALPLILKGAPIVILMPGVVYGPGDQSILAQLMARFYFGKLPFVPAPTSAYTFAHVEDVVEAHLLAAEKGRPGESYILAGPAVSLGELLNFWSYLTGKKRPPISVPEGVLRALAPTAKRLNRWVDLPEFYRGEALAMSGATYIGSAAKAEAQLGWQQRSLQAGMMETFAWLESQRAELEPPLIAEQRGLVAGAAAGLALLSATVWLLTRRRR